MITQDLLLERYTYLDGRLYYKHRHGNRSAGQLAGTVCRLGYTSIQINKRIYKLHRLVWLMFTGESPEMVDHIDQDPSNNRIENLRPATRAQNGQNSTRLRRDNTNGYRGIRYVPARKRWMAQIQVEGRKFQGKQRLSAEEAAKDYDKLAIIHHKEFAVLNFLDKDQKK